MDILLQSKLEQFDIREYAAVCESTNDEYAAVCGIAVEDYAAVCGLTNDEYAIVCGNAVEIMRQYADRVVTHTRHPAVFAVCFQSDGLLPLVDGIE